MGTIFSSTRPFQIVMWSTSSCAAKPAMANTAAREHGSEYIACKREARPERKAVQRRAPRTGQPTVVQLLRLQLQRGRLVGGEQAQRVWKEGGTQRRGM